MHRCMACGHHGIWLWRILTGPSKGLWMCRDAEACLRRINGKGK